MFTLAMIVVVRLGVQIPLPGIDVMEPVSYTHLFVDLERMEAGFSVEKVISVTPAWLSLWPV